MEIIQSSLNINFMGQRKLAGVLSIIFMIVSIVSLSTRGLNFGIDFTGGYAIEVGYDAAADLDKIRETLKQNEIDAIVINYGTAKDVMIRVAPTIKSHKINTKDAATLSDDIVKILNAEDNSAVKRDAYFVGPQVGEELKEQGGLAVLSALICILLYIMFRFEKRFALGAVMALVHDVIITLGILSILQANFDLTVLAALLAVIGYSLNDTIVVYDRVRENFRKMRSDNAVDITNTSINQTLARTIMTSLTTLMVLFSLFFLGGENIHGFALALIIGVFVGTYSSVFIASSSLLMLGLTREDMLIIKKDDVEAESRP